MKRILSLAALLFAAPLVQAQVVVTNPISDILSQTMHVEDIAKTVEMINNQVKQITTLTQQLQQIQAYVKAFGDPEKLTQITGADQLISSLKQSGVGKTIGELRQLSNGVEALQYNANGLYQSLGDTFTTPSGASVSRSTDGMEDNRPGCPGKQPSTAVRTGRRPVCPARRGRLSSGTQKHSARCSRGRRTFSPSPMTCSPGARLCAARSLRRPNNFRRRPPTRRRRS